jgi:hypothetical protein
MRLIAVLLGICALAGCAAPALTSERVGQLAYEALAPEMQMGEQLFMVWVPAPDAAAQAADPGTPVPMAIELAQVMARGAREPVNLGMGGADSAYTARVLLQALRVVPEPQLPMLRIAFVGRRADAASVAPLMAAKGAALHFEPIAD